MDATPPSLSLPATPPPANRLVAALPQRDRLRLQHVGDTVELGFAEILCQPGGACGHVYFPSGAIISLNAQIEGGRGLEVAQVGREGMLGADVRHRPSRSPLQARVLIAGGALRVGVPAFRRELTLSRALNVALDRELATLIAQLAASAACLRFHRVGPRLAGWLLTLHDRSGGASFRITHELLATTLGVRRVGITVAAGALQRQGLIVYHRGEVTVKDREGLERIACPCQAGLRLAIAASG